MFVALNYILMRENVFASIGRSLILLKILVPIESLYATFY